ncbi:MAG: hypothetical protein ACNI27_12350 [Desulfovibrio sp.]
MSEENTETSDQTNRPYYDEDGTLVIPFACADHSFKYWKKEGMEMKEVLKELDTPPEIWADYTHEKFESKTEDPDVETDSESQ